MLHFLFGLTGRLSRRGFLGFLAMAVAAEIALGLAFYAYQLLYGGYETGEPAPWPSAPLAMAAVAGWFFLEVVLQFALLTACLRRLHDRSKRAWWLIPFAALPYGLFVFAQYRQGLHPGTGDYDAGWARLAALMIAAWAFVELVCLKGDEGENRFGPDPLLR